MTHNVGVEVNSSCHLFVSRMNPLARVKASGEFPSVDLSPHHIILVPYWNTVSIPLPDESSPNANPPFPTGQAELGYAQRAFHMQMFGRYVVQSASIFRRSGRLSVLPGIDKCMCLLVLLFSVHRHRTATLTKRT